MRKIGRTVSGEKVATQVVAKEMKPARRKQFFSVRVTRKEFLKLPMLVRRRALRDMAKEAAHNRYLDTLDCEEDP